MKFIVNILISFCFVINLFSQSIENVDFRKDGKSIVVNYDLFYSNPDTLFCLEVYLEDQEGSIIKPKNISGDIMKVKPGEGKRILWEVLSDKQELSGKYKIEVKIIKFQSVKIGGQIWMSENLNIENFRNGDLIMQAKNQHEWFTAGERKEPAWCFSEYDSINGKKFGKLYNYYAVSDSRGLAPEGWHISSYLEWDELKNFLGDDNYLNQRLKSENEWKKRWQGTNESNLAVLPSGKCYNDGRFSNENYAAFFWILNTPKYNGINIYGDEKKYGLWKYDKECGMSVRCIKD